MDLSPPDWTYVEERTGAFVGREWVLAQIRSFLSGPPGTFLLRGDPGTGKTAVAGRLAQASCGRATTGSLEARAAVAEGTISAAVFCRAGKATVPELVQRLSRQLANSVDGFPDALLSTLPGEVRVEDVHIQARDVVGDVTGVRIDLSGLSDRKAFGAGLAVPLRRLRELGSAQQVVLLVDAVDEAATAGEANVFSRELAGLDGVHLIVTCRPDPPVLRAFKNPEHTVDLVADAPPDDHDVRDYIRNRLDGHGPEAAIGALISRVATEAAENFLYAFYVTGTFIRSGSLAGMDETRARSLSLPTGGLAGVYEDFLDRQIAGDETRWAGELRPVLAPLCAALGDGFTTAELAAIASHLTGRNFSPTKARDVTRAAGQFLDGPHPDGTFRLYHQSFARFLTDRRQNPNWPIDLTETNTAIVQGLTSTVPEGQPGARDWPAASGYVRRHLATHAAAAGILDDLLSDPGYLLAADPPGLLAVLGKAHSPAARRASAAYRRVAHRLAGPAEAARDSNLRLAALQAGADNLLTAAGPDTGHGADGPGWFPAWAWWRPATAARVVAELPSAATSLAALVSEQGPLAVAGGQFGLQVWDLETGQRLATDPWKVLTVAAGQVGGRPVVLAGHGDGIVTLHELPSLQLLARNEAVHTGRVLAAVILGDGSTAATGDEEGTLVLWQLPMLEALAARPKAHTMVRALADATRGSFPLLISAGDTFEPGHRRGPGTEPVRAWTLPGLRLYSDIETLGTAGELCEVAETASTPLGCIVIYRKGGEIAVRLIAADGDIRLVGTQDEERYPIDLLILEEGNEPQIMIVGGGTLALLRVTLQPMPALTLGAPVEADRYNARWAGPIDLTGRPFLVSATRTLQAWDLGEVLTPPQQDARPPSQEGYDVRALAAAGDVLAALTRGGSVHRWRWPSAEEMEPLPVRSEHIKTLASCVLAGRPHFAIAYDDGVVEAFDANSGEPWPIRIEVGAALQAMAVGSQDARTVAATAVQLGLEPERRGGRPFYGVRLWDLTTGTEIPTRLPETGLALIDNNRDNEAFTWKLRAERHSKQLHNLAAVEAADDLFIVAGQYGSLKAWPLQAIDSSVDMWSYRDDIRMLVGRDGLLAVVTSDGRWELWRLGNGASTKSSGEFPGVGALVIGSWQGTPALVTGGGDGWLRVWSQGGTPLLSIDVGEPVTALTIVSEDRIAAGTGRGVVIFHLPGAKIPAEPLEAKLAELRTAAREQRMSYWEWRSWRRGVFPPATPDFHHGPAREIAELLAASPAQTLRALSSWLDDDTRLARHDESTVADVTCSLMGSYSHAAFDELCDALADIPGTVEGESQNPFLLLQTLMTIAPESGAGVCERWSAGDARRAQLATVCVHWILRRDPPPELRARLLAIESRILGDDSTPLARTEALHTLAEWPETRGLVIRELADRFRGRAEGYASAAVLSKALATHFDLVLEAFEQRLMRDPARYDYGVVSAPADYVPATDTEAARILDLYERLWNAGPGEPEWQITRSLLTFAGHPSRSRIQAVALAIKIAHVSGSESARETVAETVFSDGYDNESRQHILDAITEAADPEMKGTIVAELARKLEGGFPSPEALFEPIGQVTADQLEAKWGVLLIKAQNSRSFASALVWVIQQTTPPPKGKLATFAEKAVSQADPQTAARQTIQDITKKP